MTVASTKIHRPVAALEQLAHDRTDAVVAVVDGRIAYLNPAMAAMLGALHANDLLGRRFLDFAPGTRLGAWERLICDALAAETDPIEESLPLLRLDGAEMPCTVSASCARLGARRASQLIVRPSENALAPHRPEGEPLLRKMLDQLPSMVAYIDASERYRYMNRAYTLWHGLEEPPLGETVRDFLGDAAYFLVEPQLRRALDGYVVEAAALVPFPRLGNRRVRLNYAPDVDEAGAVRGCFLLASDQTAAAA